jgi:hypothetical protein
LDSYRKSEPVEGQFDPLQGQLEPLQGGLEEVLPQPKRNIANNSTSATRGETAFMGEDLVFPDAE